MPPLVIGVGNADRGDDGVGRVVAQRLRELSWRGADIEEASGEAAALLSLFRDRDAVVIVDACQSGQPAGTIHQFDVSAAPLPTAVRILSSHGFGVPEAIELARTLGELPPRSVVIAIEGQSFQHGSPLSPAVDGAVDQAMAAVSRIIDNAANAGNIP